MAFSCLAVGLTPLSFAYTVETGAPEAIVETRYPTGDLPKAENALMGMITQFCFPDKEKFPKHQLSPKSRKFTFVVTNIDGAKRFGYVKRSLTGQISISNQGKRWPIAHCVLSAFPCHSIFDQILEATGRLESPQVLDLMSQIRNHSLPAPGDAIYATVTVGDPAAPRLEPFRFSRPEQESSLSGFADFKALLLTIDPFTIASILMALLMERRVIFISRKLSTLSSCVQACVALLYPFSWQHVFIPVLPLAMIQFVCAPVPFVVGLLAAHLPELQAQSELMEEVLLIDVESSSPVPPSQDYKLVPEKYLLPLVATIAKARRSVLDEKKKTKSDKSMGDKLKNFFASDKNSSLNASGSRTTVALAEYYREAQPADNVAKMMENAFISFFAETMGHYTNYLTATEFDKEPFLTFDPPLEPFLRGVGGSQLFEQFIVQRQASSRVKGRTQPLGAPPPARRATSNQADLTTDAKLADVVVREGYISKWGKGMKGTAWARLKEGKDHRGKNDETMVGTFQLRYWKMSYFNLTYHKSEDSKPSGTIALQDIVSVNLIEFRGAHDCLEIVTADRVYQLHTDNNADMMWWYELMTWKLGLIREYHPRPGGAPVPPAGHTSSIAPPLAGAATPSTLRDSVPPGRSNTAPPSAPQWVNTPHAPGAPAPASVQLRHNGGNNAHGSGGFDSLHTHEAPPASMPALRGSGGLAGPTPPPIASKPSPMNRAPSKAIVSSYMKDRLSSERVANGSLQSPSDMGGGASVAPHRPPKPEKFAHGHPTPVPHHAPSNGGFGGAKSVSSSSPSSGPPPSGPPPSAPPSAPPPSSPSDAGAVRGRATAMRSTSGGNDHVAPYPREHSASVSHASRPLQYSQSAAISRPHPALQPTRSLKRFPSQDPSEAIEALESPSPLLTPEESAHQERKISIINRLSLSPPKVRPLPPTPAGKNATPPTSAPGTPKTAPLSFGSSSSSPISQETPPSPDASGKRVPPMPPKLGGSSRTALTKTTPAASSPAPSSSATLPTTNAKRPLPRPP